MSDERLGSWVVLRRLADDLLGPTWRLARADLQGGVERLALGRAFIGAGLAAEGRNLAAVVDHPFVATTADLFDHQGQCIVAWDYTSGHSLREILERASDRMMPLNPGLCLLIAERVAQGLAAASQRQLDGKALHHGLLRPELVWVTNDGEVKILGFEIGRALAARLAGSPAFGPFLAPEVRAGSPVEARDDVYSLAAVLHAALTGIDPPSHDADRAAEDATSAEDGAPLPAELTRLLASCLGPRSGRPANPGALHDALREISLTAARRVGPFELAYAIHGLFGDEITTEARELERGGRPEPVGGPASPRAASVPAGPQPLPTQPVVVASFADELRAEPAKPRRAPWLPIAAGIAVVAVGVGLVLSRDQGGSPPAATPAAQPAPVASPTVPAGPSPEELQAQIRALVEQRTGAVAAEMRDQQEAEIKALQEQLAAAQAATVAVPEPAPRPTPPVPTPVPVTSPHAGTSQPPASPATAAPPEPSANAQAAPATPAAASTVASSPAAAAPPPQAAPRVEPAAPPRAATSTPPATPSATAIATPGPGVTPPTMLTFAKPEYPLLARRTKVQGTVILSILVDEQGRATDIKFLKRVEQDVGLNEAAEKAARASTWRPASKDGKPVKMWFTLPVPFALE